MDYKVVLVTDRTQLDNQLTETAQNIGYSIVHPDKIDIVKSTIKDGSYNIASIMIQKFQDKDLEVGFPTLDKSDRIIVLTDEAHRSQYKLLRANLDKAVPKATHIGFTGTPIDKTEDTFGDYIDKYTMRQAIDDGVTLEIVYEGKATKTAITDRAAADKAFLDVFVDEDAANLTKILGYGSRRAYIETQSVIERKAKDMLNHYLTEVFPNGFKAQIVAVSKEAAHRYKLVLDAAIKDAVSNAKYNDLPDECIAALSKLKAEVIVSSEHNEDSHLKVYNDKRKQEADIASFKIAFNTEKDGVSGDVGILIVVDMLTTGFDAPIEQVMYVDKVMVMHNLLQAVARVNRVGGKGKDVGYIVDYVGIGHHLKEALDSYHEREQKEVLSCLTDINDLANSVVAANNDLDEFFKKYKITDFTDYDAVFNLFYDDDIRMLFMEKFRAFSKAINNAN